MNFRKRILPLAIISLSIAAAWIYMFYDLPGIENLAEHYLQPSLRVTDRNGQVLYEIIPSAGGRHIPLSFASIPKCMLEATIAVEDKSFYTNSGIDLKGMLRSVWINLQGGEILAGGSTITQQVARNLLLTDELGTRSFRRKTREAVLAWKLTRKLTKDEILAIYLNQTYYGGMAYGVEAAAQTYFGKSASTLMLHECALLAGLPQSPGTYNPYTNADKARERQLVVLGLMEKNHFITLEESQLAEESTLHYLETPYPIEAPHFIWMVKAQVDALYDDGSLNPTNSLVVRTTLDLNMQKIAEAAISRQLAEYRQRTPYQNVNNAALVAIEPKSGEILAFVGSADYFDNSIDGAVDMALANRQPGSSFKPFIYALALDPQGSTAWTAANPILDVKTTFLTHDNAAYTPLNYDGKEHGPVSVRQALASSLNIPAVIALQQVGIADTIHFAERLGITSLGDPDEYDLSLALGGGQISLVELTSAYSVLANNGIKTDHHVILDIKDADENLLYQPEKSPAKQVIDPRVTWLLSDILSDDEARRLGFGVNSTLRIDRPAAVKTGTTTNFHDNWTIGYTPDIVIGVWVGNSDYQAMKEVTGLTGAAPIWHETIRKILEGRPKVQFSRPEDLIQLEVCTLSGLLPTDICQHRKTDWFIKGTEPTEYDTIYKKVIIDGRTGKIADSSTPSDDLESKIVFNLPIEAQSWARLQGLPLLVDFPPANDNQNKIEITLISPRNQTTYRIDPTFDLFSQKILIEAVTGAGIDEIEIWVDGALLTTLTNPPYQTWWQLSPGKHQIWATGITDEGEIIYSETITISVIE